MRGVVLLPLCLQKIILGGLSEWNPTGLKPVLIPIRKVFARFLLRFAKVFAHTG